jgi:hypothetical protein
MSWQVTTDSDYIADEEASADTYRVLRDTYTDYSGSCTVGATGGDEQCSATPTSLYQGTAGVMDVTFQVLGRAAANGQTTNTDYIWTDTLQVNVVALSNDARDEFLDSLLDDVANMDGSEAAEAVSAMFETLDVTADEDYATAALQPPQRSCRMPTQTPWIPMQRRRLLTRCYVRQPTRARAVAAGAGVEGEGRTAVCVGKASALLNLTAITSHRVPQKA